MAKKNSEQGKKPASGNVWLTKNIPSLAKLLGVTADSESNAPDKVKKAARPHLPIVNLLPPRLELEKLRRSTRRGFAFAALLIIVSTSFFWVIMSILNGIADSSLTAARSELSAANAQVGKYAAVAQYYGELEQRVAYVKTVEANSVNYQAVTDTVLSTLPEGSSLQGMAITALDRSDPAATKQALAAQCGSPTDPFATETVDPLACLTFTGIVTDRRQVAEIMVALQKSNILSNVSVGESKTGNATNAAGASISFSGSAVINQNAHTSQSVLDALTAVGGKK